MGLLIPSILVVMGIALLNIKPKINSWFGYRTKKSMENEECWKFANKVMSLCLIYINTLVCIPVICILNIFIRNTIVNVFSVLGLIVLGLILSIIITEKKLNNYIKQNEKHK